jgi:hypothetical protein
VLSRRNYPLVSPLVRFSVISWLRRNRTSETEITCLYSLHDQEQDLLFGFNARIRFVETFVDLISRGLLINQRAEDHPHYFASGSLMTSMLG